MIIINFHLNLFRTNWYYFFRHTVFMNVLNGKIVKREKKKGQGDCCVSNGNSK